MPTPRLILASGSPQRHALLTEAGYQFSVVPPDESAECGVCATTGPAELVIELALKKAADVIRQLTVRQEHEQQSLVLACDTVAECKGVILGKPENEDHARTMLEQLRGQRHRVYSGVCLWQIGSPAAASAPVTRLAVSELVMSPLSDDELDAYLETGLWQNKAGAFGIQDQPEWLQIVSGSESNVIGLPMEVVSELLSPWEEELQEN